MCDIIIDVIFDIILVRVCVCVCVCVCVLKPGLGTYDNAARVKKARLQRGKSRGQGLGFRV